MKSFFKWTQRGSSVGSTISVVTGLALLVVGSIAFYIYVMQSWRVSAMIGELKQRSNSVLKTGSLDMREFPRDCQGFSIQGLKEEGLETVFVLRVRNVDVDTCRLLVEKYPSDWFHLFVNDQQDVAHTMTCSETGNKMDFVFMREQEKTLPDCLDIICFNGGTCLRGVCTCPAGVTGLRCTRANDCVKRDNGTRCTLAGRNFDGVCLDDLCQNEGECPTLTWKEAQLYCQANQGLPEVLPLYSVSGQIVDSNANGYWMAYLKNPQTRNDYQQTACFMNDVVIWTRERPQNNETAVWTVEMHSGHVVAADETERHQVLCNRVFGEKTN